MLARTVFAALIALAALGGGGVLAAEFDGTWQASFRGQTYFIDEDSTQSVVTLSTLTISSEDQRIVVDVGEIEGAFEATRFTGSGGKSAFSAISWNAAVADHAPVVYGRLKSDQLEGRLIVPRAAEGMKPGWTELTFVATRKGTAKETLDERRRRPGQVLAEATNEEPDTAEQPIPGATGNRLKTPSLGTQLSPPGKLTLPKLSKSAPTVPPAHPETFVLELYDATEPSKPTDKQKVRFGLRALAPRGVDIERVELYVNDKKTGSASGDTIDLTKGPYSAGRITYSVVAFSSTGVRGQSARRSLEIRPAGTAVVSGTISGRTELISGVELVDANEIVVQRTRLDNAGRFSFRDLAVGRYWVFVDDGKREARIRVTRGSQEVQCDGRSRYQVDFSVE